MPSSDHGGHWLLPLTSWPGTLCDWLAQGPVARIVVAEVKGSAPREPGACMLVSPARLQGSIGGGNLEWQAITAARALLAAGDTAPPVRIQRLVLGKELAQCCGGAVQLWMERFTAVDRPLLATAAQRLARGLPVGLATLLAEGRVSRELRPPRGRLQFSGGEKSALLLEQLEPGTPLWLYGAGHVGQALVQILAALPFEITWVDSRAELLPDSLPPAVRTLCASDPVDTVRLVPPTARILVMTHDHALDYALCRAFLERGTLGWLGLIGSASKAARFRSRLARDGLAPAAVTQLTCPIGLTSIPSKLPAAIAVGIAAQLLSGLTTHALLPLEAPHEMREACTSPSCAACAAVASLRS
jgi:xanthine dehydrogenase accessory factor